MTQIEFFFSETAPPANPAADTDCGWLLRYLWDGHERTLNEIIGASFRERGCGLTVHSRISDLRKKHGFVVEQRHVDGGKRGGSSAYRLVR